jgi:hypothetical protein
VVNTIEEFSDVALKRITGQSSVPAHFSQHTRQHIDAIVGSFSDAARKRIGNKSRLKNRIQGCEYGMVQNAISHARLMDMPQLRVLDVKVGVRSMPISLIAQTTVKAENILFKFFLKGEYVLLHALSALEFVPCRK